MGEGEDGRALVRCHAGCDVEAICSAVGLRVVDLMPKICEPHNPSKVKNNAKPRIVAKYSYRDEAGKLLFQALRYEPKDFRQRRPAGRGRWEWSVKGVRVVPYNLPDLIAKSSKAVMVVEGEKDVDNLARLGVLATCNSGGAGKWTGEHAKFLAGRKVVVLPDNDEHGQNHAQQVAQSLQSIAQSVRVVNLPGLQPKGDVSDWIAAGGTREELKRLAEATPLWTLEAQPWPEIQPFDVLYLPEFPTAMLPEVLRNWVEAESHATQTPADLAALLALSVCAVGIARRVVVEPRPGWREPVNLFTAVLLEPGNRKSAVFSDAIKPLRDVETELIEASMPEVARMQSARRQDEARLRKLEKVSAEKGDILAREEAGDLSVGLANLPEPVLPRLLVDDATAEKLGIMLAEQGGRIASMSPEGGVFDLIAGLYSKSGMPQFGVYLMGHSGDDLITDRVSRKSVSVERPALTCAYAIQPAVIEGLADNTAFRGRGLLARFLYAAPRSWIGQREIAPAPVSDVIREAYRQTVRRLLSTEGEITLELDSHADAHFQGWEAEIEEMLGDGGLMETTRDWGAKLAGATLRIAVVLHCVEHGLEGQIEMPTIVAAIEIADYLVPHAEAVLTLMCAGVSNDNDGSQYVLRWIERHGLSHFTKRDAQQHGKRKFPRAEDIDPALKTLVLRGYIRERPIEKKGPGRPPSPVFDVNPLAFVDAKPKGCSFNSQNSFNSSETSDTEDNENAPEHILNKNGMEVTM
ncbi:DUF3987 domain-containing protein [Aeoliella mucimassa]|uniref:DUF3987 domain-containing protein n=1 Tax=Aeoliella mucimassa TaxID=2527972 RepID=UPI0011A516B6|nr:DUF3987 domain-containing protein [Aeoliella mucimassa]